VDLTSATYMFDTKNAGTDKNVTVSGLNLIGADAGNYSLTMPVAVLADIAQKEITFSLSGTLSKTYDGTTATTLDPDNVDLSGVIAGDTVTPADGSAAYADPHAGSGKPVTITGLSLAGADSGNYRLAPSTVTADIGQIDQRPITLTANDIAKLWGQIDPALTYKVTAGSFVAQDGTTGALTRVTGEAPGTYAILQGNLGVSADYALTFVGGQFFILTSPTETSLAGILPDDSQFTSTTGLVPGVPSVNETLAAQTQTASTDQNDTVTCPVEDLTCANAPYPTNRHIGPDIRFGNGL
jgi:hypothetical protein